MHRTGAEQTAGFKRESRTPGLGGTSMQALENRIPPPVVALLVAAAMWALARWWPLARFEVAWQGLIGLMLAAAGGIISNAGAREFKRAETTVNPLHPERATSVVTTGIYRFT